MKNVFSESGWASLLWHAIVVLAIPIPFLIFSGLQTALIVLPIELVLLALSVLISSPFTTINETEAKIVTRFGAYAKTLWYAKGFVELEEADDVQAGTVILRMEELYMNEKCTEKQKCIDVNRKGRREIDSLIRNGTIVYYKRLETKHNVFKEIRVELRNPKDPEKKQEWVIPKDQIFYDYLGKKSTLTEIEKDIADHLDDGLGIFPDDFFSIAKDGFYTLDPFEPDATKKKAVQLPLDSIIDHEVGFRGVPVKILRVDHGESMLQGGLFFVGLWPFFKVRSYHFVWTSLLADNKPDPRNEILQKILLRDDLYNAFLPSVEIANNLQVSLIMQMKIRTVNPYKAMFRIEKWLESVQQLIQSIFRGLVGGSRFEDIRGSREQIGQDLWSIFTRKICDPKGEDIERRYGIRVLVVYLLDVKPIIGDENDPLSAQFKAEQFGHAAITKAELEGKASLKKAEFAKRVAVTTAEGEALAIREKTQAVVEFGDLGKLMEYLKSMEKLGQGEGKIILLPASVDTIAKGLTGLAESVTKEK